MNEHFKKAKTLACEHSYEELVEAIVIQIISAYEKDDSEDGIDATERLSTLVFEQWKKSNVDPVRFAESVVDAYANDKKANDDDLVNDAYARYTYDR